MVRIAVVLASEVLGGHEFQAAQLAHSLSQHHQVTVLLNGERFLPIFDAMPLTVAVYPGLFFSPGHIGFQCLRGLKRRRAIAEVLSGFDQVVVSAGTVEAALTVGVALLGQRRAQLYLPFLYDRRVLWGVWGIVYTLALKALLNLFDRVITINRVQARLMSGCHPKPVAVVSNHVMPIPPLPDRHLPPRLVYIGRFDAQKCILELMSFLDHDDNPFADLLLIGDGPLRPQIEAAAKKTSRLRVSLLGWLDRSAQQAALQRVDILLLNSLIEGEPMVLREAAAAGMVALARDIPGVRGVTRPSLRFSNGEELRHLLKKLAREPNHGGGAFKAKHDHVRRDAQIERLFKVQRRDDC